MMAYGDYGQRVLHTLAHVQTIKQESGIGDPSETIEKSDSRDTELPLVETTNPSLISVADTSKSGGGDADEDDQGPLYDGGNDDDEDEDDDVITAFNSELKTRNEFATEKSSIFRVIKDYSIDCSEDSSFDKKQWAGEEQDGQRSAVVDKVIDDGKDDRHKEFDKKRFGQDLDVRLLNIQHLARMAGSNPPSGESSHFDLPDAFRGESDCESDSAEPINVSVTVETPVRGGSGKRSSEPESPSNLASFSPAKRRLMDTRSSALTKPKIDHASIEHSEQTLADGSGSQHEKKIERDAEAGAVLLAHEEDEDDDDVSCFLANGDVDYRLLVQTPAAADL
ncbi:unnamed protein product [Protopolystoma xenopodis]|uniref:Uncharacterized protein n=1 Tax=Protopolystoma xenopodis TaxID=117903 RepID=A0A3S5CUI8_9PLAT|nr:unnamed protein product [Protopolystoma xenopodis]